MGALLDADSTAGDAVQIDLSDAIEMDLLEPVEPMEQAETIVEQTAP